MHSTAYTDVTCQTHLRDKESIYFPQQQPQKKSPAGPSEWEQIFNEPQPASGSSGFKGDLPTSLTIPSGVHQRKKEQHTRTYWSRGYWDGCWAAKEEKTKHNHYPRRPMHRERRKEEYGKGRESISLRGGERQSTNRHRGNPMTNSRVVGRTGQKLEENC